MTGGGDERSRAKVPERVPPEGLCPSCRHVRVVRTERGSTFLLCEAARTDPRLQKYAPQPVLACHAWER